MTEKDDLVLRGNNKDLTEENSEIKRELYKPLKLSDIYSDYNDNLYVKYGTVVRYLDRVQNKFGRTYDVEVADSEIVEQLKWEKNGKERSTPHSAVATVRIRIGGYGSREHGGTTDVQASIDTSYKGAISNAIVKTGSLFGIASQLYEKCSTFPFESVNKQKGAKHNARATWGDFIAATKEHLIDEKDLSPDEAEDEIDQMIDPITLEDARQDYKKLEQAGLTLFDQTDTEWPRTN